MSFLDTYDPAFQKSQEAPAAAFLDRYDPAVKGQMPAGNPSASFLDRYDPAMQPKPPAKPGLLSRLGRVVKPYIDNPTTRGYASLATHPMRIISGALSAADQALMFPLYALGGAADALQAAIMTGDLEKIYQAFNRGMARTEKQLPYYKPPTPESELVGRTAFAPIEALHRAGRAVSELSVLKDKPADTDWAGWLKAQARGGSQIAGDLAGMLAMGKIFHGNVEKGAPPEQIAALARKSDELRRQFADEYGLTPEAAGRILTGQETGGMHAEKTGTEAQAGSGPPGPEGPPAPGLHLRDLEKDRLEAIRQGTAAPVNTLLSQRIKGLAEQARAALPPGQGFELVGAPRTDLRQSEGIRQLKGRLKEKVRAREIAAAPEIAVAGNIPRSLGLGRERPAATRLRGRLEELGKISWKNARGEVVDMPRSVSYVSNNRTGLPWEDVQQILRDEGWIGPDESLPELLRTDPQGTLNRRHPVTAGEIFDLPRNQLSKEEKRLRDELEQPDKQQYSDDEIAQLEKERLAKERQEQGLTEEEQRNLDALTDFFDQVSQPGRVAETPSGYRAGVPRDFNGIFAQATIPAQHVPQIVIDDATAADVIRRNLAGKPRPVLEQKHPKLVLTGGPPGAGKSTGLARLGIDKAALKQMVHGDADAIKEQLGYADRAAQAHEASSDINKELVDQAIKRGYDVVYDSLLSSYPTAKRLIEKRLAKDNGEVSISFTNIDAPTSTARSIARVMKNESDRIIPLDVSIKGHNYSLPTFIQLFKEYKDNRRVAFSLVDNNVDFKKPRVVMTKRINEPPRIHDQALFDKLMGIDYHKTGGGKYERVQSIHPEGLRRISGEIAARAEKIVQAHRQAQARGLRESQQVFRRPGRGTETNLAAAGRISRTSPYDIPHPQQAQLAFGPPRKSRVSADRQAAARMGISFGQPGRDSAIRLETTGNIKGKDYFVRSADEAASLLAPLRKKAQEEAYLVITDKHGRILEVERHTKGLKAASQLDIPQMAGRAFNTPEAANVYFVHNHPSGDPLPSPHDMQAAGQLGDFLRLKNIKLQNLVIGRRQYARFDPRAAHPADTAADLRPILRTATIPVRERTLKKLPATEKLNDHVEVRDYLKKNNLMDQEGAILLDAKLHPMGVWRYRPGQPMRDFAADLIGAVERHNASMVLPFFKSSIMKPERDNLRNAIWKVRDATQITIPDIVLSDTGMDASQASHSSTRRVPARDHTSGAVRDLNSGTRLYGGLPLQALSEGARFWEKYIGAPVWDKWIMGKIPDALEKIPVAGRGVSAMRRALDYNYRGDLKDSPGYVRSLDKMRRGRQIGAEYGIDLGNRLQSVPEDSQLRIGQAITGQDVSLSPAEEKLASEASWALLELGKQAVDAGLLDEKTFFKNAGRYMPRLYTSKEYQGLLSRYGERAPERLDLERFRRRKDIPAEIRQQMGEILTPGYPVAKGIVQLSHSIQTARWLARIAENPDWAYTPRPPADVIAAVKGEIADARAKNKQAPLSDVLEQVAAAHPDLNIYARKIKTGKGWRTQTVIEKAGEIPAGFVKLPQNQKLGALAGAWVHPEIARDVNWTLKAPAAADRIIRKLTTKWKSGKVIWSLKTHVRNMYANALLAHLGGQPLWSQPLYLARAAREMRSRGKYWRLAKREGLLSSTFVSGELRDLYDRVERQMAGVKAGSLEDTLTGIGKAVTAIRRMGKKLGDAYQAEEEWFKLSKFMHDMQKRGMTPEQAAADASKWLFDYGRVTRFQERYRNSLLGAPFATFTFKAIPRVLEAAVKTPQRFILPAAIIWGLEEAARRDAGDTRETAQLKKKARPDWMGGHFLGLPWLPNFARVPVTDNFGRDHWLNLSYMTPWGDLGESGGWGGIPGGLQPFSHPFLKEAIQQGTNYDWFWKQPILKPEDVAGQSGAQRAWTEFKKRGAHLAQTMLPTPVMDIGKVYDALRGKPDYRGRERGLGIVLADVLAGLKMYPVDYIEQLDRRLAKLNPTQSDAARQIMGRIKTARRQKAAVAARGGSTELYDRRIAGYVDQLQGLARQAAGVRELRSRLQKR